MTGAVAEPSLLGRSTARGWKPRTLRIRQADALFLVIATVFVALYVALLPPGWGLDEQSHVFRAYQVSQGVLVPEHRGESETLGADVPASMVALQMWGHGTANAIDRKAQWWERRDLEDVSVAAALWQTPIGGGAVFFDISNAAASPFVPYLSAALGLRVGESVNLDTGTTLLLGRLFNAAFFVTLVWFAIRLLRPLRVRWVLFALALLPQTLFQASYITADTYSNAVALLFVACVLRLALVPSRRGLSELTLTAVVGLALVAAKPSYAVVLLLMVVIPSRRLVPPGVAGRVRRGDRAGYAVVFAYWMVAGSVAVLLLYLTRNASTAIAATYDHGADPRAQVSYLLGAPAEVFAIVARTLGKFSSTWPQGVVGLFGYNAVQLIEPFVLLAVFCVILAALNAERMSMSQALVLIGVSALGVVVIIMALYVSFSPVHSPFADGVQGRYLLPLLAPLVIGLARFVPGRLALAPARTPAFFSSIGVAVNVAALVLWLLFLL